GGVSDTFIRAHIKRLPFDCTPFFGVKLGIADEGGKKLWRWGHWFNAAASQLYPALDRWLSTFLLARLLKTGRVDAVLAEYGTTGSWIASACERARVPLFVHFHGADASVEEVLEREREGYRGLFRIATGIVAVSQPMRAKLVDMGAPIERVYLNACGVDPIQFELASLQRQDTRFLSVGRFVEKKAPYLTILAFDRVLKELPGAQLIMIGDGPLWGPCARLIEALGLSNAVHLKGAQSHTIVRDEMQKAAIYVQHSLVARNGDSEGTPVAVVEAQMSSLPVVATRHAGIPEVVLDGETGYLVDEADIEGMANAMTRLAMEPGLARQMGENARNRAIDKFTMERHIDGLARMIVNGISNAESWHIVQ
ncbi:MAG: glycosyltransferase, partial [Woeseiaceae bacterium]